MTVKKMSKRDLKRMIAESLGQLAPDWRDRHNGCHTYCFDPLPGELDTIGRLDTAKYLLDGGSALDYLER